MSMVRSCHHYYVGGNVCGICGHDKTPGSLLDEHGITHRAAWKDAAHTLCQNATSHPERYLTVKATRRKTVNCLRCVRWL